jgi:hypothetical protein
MALFTKKGELAITKPEFKKIEAEVVGGMARISQRIAVTEAVLVMNYNFQGVELRAGDKILLRGDSGLTKWAANELRLETGEVFVLCPEDVVLGYRTLVVGHGG